MCDINDGFQRIGYVVEEATAAVHDAIARNDITVVKLKWVKYVSDWFRSGPGCFAAVSITKKGVWSPSVEKYTMT